jgi:enamine deaminase RidA (YjgF/YER057c/UK114 family)
MKKNAQKTLAFQQHLNLNLHITEAGKGQFYLVAISPDSRKGSLWAANAYAEIAAVLSQGSLAIVHERIFGSLDAEAAVRAARSAALTAEDISPETPVTYIEGTLSCTDELCGIIIRAVSCSEEGHEVWTIWDGQIPCGRGWRRNNATFLVLQNLQGLEGGPGSVNTPPVQTWHMLERAERILQQQGASYHDVIRTWFYLDDIPRWYDEFNKVRNAKYRSFGMMPGPGNEHLLLPASTGIRGSNTRGSAGVLELFAAVGTKISRPAIKQLSNAGQKDAFCYGSAFSRGALVCENDVSLFQLSGTAAIDEEGKSLYPDDIRSQIDCTFDKVEALLGQTGGRLSDICAATVFVKRPEYVSIFREMATARGLDHFPAVCVVTDICRKELLFEIDAEAVIKKVTVSQRLKE